jgi:hypothetical protein
MHKLLVNQHYAYVCAQPNISLMMDFFNFISMY